MLLPVGLPLLLLAVCPARGVEVPLEARPVRESSLLSPQLRGLRIQEWLSRGGACCPLRFFLSWLSTLITARSAR